MRSDSETKVWMSVMSGPIGSDLLGTDMTMCVCGGTDEIVLVVSHRNR